MPDYSQRLSQRLVMDTLQRDVLFRAVISATSFQNFSSHVNLRRDMFVSSLLPEV